MSPMFRLSTAAMAVMSAAPLLAETLPIEQLATAPGAKGIWQSDGYGYLLSVPADQNEPQLFHLTEELCLALDPEEDSPLNYIESFATAASGKTLRFKGEKEPYEVTFRKLDAMPDQCATSVNPRSAIANFDAFVSYFAAHYAFFDVHNPQWLEMAKGFRAEIDANSGDGDIIEPMIGLLSSLKDGHVSIEAVVDGDEGQFIAYPGPTLTAVQERFTGEGSPMAAFGQQYLRRDIEQGILNGHGHNAANERIKYGITGDNIGYMAIMSEGGFISGGEAPAEQELTALNAALDEIISGFNEAGVKAVLIDLSVNRGGYDFLGRAMAARFAKARTLAYSKYAGDAQDQTPQKVYVEAGIGPSFHGPIYVLTSDVTVSAGETLALSLRALPNVTHVGAKTRGALSDVLTKRLPNGWSITLSNEVYTDHRGEVWEGRGITPDVEFQVFDPQNPFSGHMPAIERTIALIDEQVEG